MMSPKVFYAWQSDCDQKVCHYFIRDALKTALKQIIKDAKDDDVQEATRPELDHDRKDVPGTPRIAETIEKKIRKAAVFVADLTAVTDFVTFDGREKQTPNANVLIELGMAFRSVKSERILLVMNTAFGLPEHLPFDLKDRSHPIQYEVKDRADPDYKAKQKTLAEKLVEPLKLCLKHFDQQEGGRSAVAQAARQAAQEQYVQNLSERRDRLMAKVQSGEFHELPGTVKASLTVVPTEAVIVPITYPPDHILDFEPLWHISGSNWDNDSDAMLFKGMDHENKILSVTEVYTDGLVFAAMNGGLEMTQRTDKILAENFKLKDVPESGIPFAMIQKYVIGGAMGYMSAIRTKFKYSGPFSVSFIISGLKGYRIRPVSGGLPTYRLKACRDDSKGGTWHTIPSGANVADMNVVAEVFKDDFRSVWRHGGFSDNPCWVDGRYVPRTQ